MNKHYLNFFPADIDNMSIRQLHTFLDKLENAQELASDKLSKLLIARKFQN
tara:strand:+ start:478 stop:630 length:153 start_codon:yes stop_codon:yes gene_type:complete